jgi:segregation and condensation protein B
MENPNLDNIVLALLFASDEPLTARKIAALVEDVTVADVKQAIDTWNARADAEAWSIAIEQVAGGYRLATRPEYAAYVSRLYAGRRKFRLSRAGLETLAIVAYKQPITRAEIESIRGVGSGSVLANLMERGLVEIGGKAKVLGAPFLYGTTTEFLEYLGLNTLRDLPSLEDLEALLAQEAGAESMDGDDVAAPAGELLPGGTDTGLGTVDFVASLADAIDGADETLDLDAGDERPRATAARLGPRINEPVNRPLGAGSIQPAASDATSSGADENADGDVDDLGK